MRPKAKGVISAADRSFLSASIELGALGLYSTSPNPAVGCLIVRHGQVLGRGYHQRAGEGHAEVNAIADANAQGYDVSGATVYVSLEPCAFVGRTPACADTLVNAGVGRVVAALTDPHPKVSGSGFAKLRAAGIAVDVVELPEAAELIAGYAKYAVEQRPFVRLKAAMSLDGRTAMASGESQWITGAAARSDVQSWRARSSAIITGSGTVLEDNPAMTVRAEEYALEGVIRQPLRVVLDSNLQTSPSAQIYQDPATSLVVHAQDTAADRSGFAAVELVPCGSGTVDLPQLLTILGERRCSEVLVEAGATLLGSFIEQKLWDELVLYVAPKILGSAARPLFSLPLTHMAQGIGATIQSVVQVGDDLRLVLRPAASA